MKEIIKQGKIIIPTYQVECYKCKTIFTYQNEDIAGTRMNESYVECPTCKQYLDHTSKNIKNG